MFRFQFAVAIVLGLSAFFSAALFFWLFPPNGGKIQLPTSYDSPDSDDESEPELPGENDPFVVTRPEDFVDGEPIDEENFWVKVSNVIVTALLKMFWLCIWDFHMMLLLELAMMRRLSDV